MNILGFISGSVIALVFGSIVGVIALLIVVASVRASRMEKRKSRYRRDMQLLTDYFYEYYEYFPPAVKKQYFALPNHATRSKFMQEEQPEFWRALQRVKAYEDAYLNPQRNIEESYLAKYIDFRFIKWQDSGYVLSFEEAFDLYRYNKDLSLSDLQILINEEQAKKQEREAHRAAIAKKQEEFLAKREAERLAKIRADQEAAKTYWESLSDEAKERFKNARGKGGRHNALPKPENTSYTVDSFYPILMSTYFVGVSPYASDSITNCENSSSSSSSYGGGDSYSDSSYSSYDGGSSFSDGGSCF